MASISDLLPPPDPRTENLLFMVTFPGLVVISAIYLLIIYKIGPAIMKNRAPFELKGVLIGYNLLQVFFNLLLFISSVPYWPKTNVFCGPIDKSNDPGAVFVTQLTYCYYLLKFFDLVETAFFVLRKKSNQVSLLHVYHHVSMILASWIGLRFYPGGQFMYFGVFNTLVHAIMYIYYLLSIWDPKYKTSIWWKRYLTQVQIVHQIFIWVTNTGPLYIKDCSVPKFPCVAIALNGCVIIPMFLHFYTKNYVFKKKTSSD